MTKTVSIRTATLVAALTSIAGVGIGLWVGQARGDGQLLSLSLAHELEASGLCANSLKLNALQKGDRLTVLLEQRLDSAVQHASDLVDEGVRLHANAPNLKDSIRRAADYYESKGDLGRKQSAETLLARFDSSR